MRRKYMLSPREEWHSSPPMMVLTAATQEAGRGSKPKRCRWDSPVDRTVREARHYYLQLLRFASKFSLLVRNLNSSQLNVFILGKTFQWDSRRDSRRIV